MYKESVRSKDYKKSIELSYHDNVILKSAKFYQNLGIIIKPRDFLKLPKSLAF